MIHGVQRQLHAFHEPSGPPWIHSSSGWPPAGASPSGSTSQPRTRVPSSATVSTSSRVPGIAGRSTGFGRRVASPVARSIRATSGGNR